MVSRVVEVGIRFQLPKNEEGRKGSFSGRRKDKVDPGKVL